MAAPGHTLLVRVHKDHFTFTSPAGDRFLIDLAVSKPKRDAAERILSATHPLSPSLQAKIEAKIKYQESRCGLLKQCCFGIFLPAGLLLGNEFNLDSDLPTLHNAVADVLSNVFAPGEYRLEEYVTDGEFKDGWILLRLFL